MLVAGLAAAAWFAGATPVRADTKDEPDVRMRPLVVAMEIVGQLRKLNDLPPSMKAWCRQFDEIIIFETREKVAEDTGKDLSEVKHGKYVGPDIDKLLRKNPLWWETVFSWRKKSNDLDILYSNILLAAGQADQTVAYCRFAMQRPDLADEVREEHLKTANAALRAPGAATDLVEQGTKKHDQGNYQEAVKLYEQALRLWPHYGLAYYEKAYSLRSENIKKNKQPDPKEAGESAVPDKLYPNTPESLAALEAARACDPFRLANYQTAMPVEKLLLLIDGFNEYAKLEQDSKFHPDLAGLTKLIDLCSHIGAHDCALLLLQARVARQGKALDEDLRQIEANLIPMVGEQQAKRIAHLLPPGPLKD